MKQINLCCILEIVDLVAITIRNWYDQLLGIFTDKEAWFLFRLAAFLETFSWGLLIFGIVSKKFEWPAYEFILPIAGSIHGVLIISYTLIVFFAHRSVGWGVGKFIVAEIVGNFPGGALVFEIIVSHQRKKNDL